ncbi:MAG: hypothetical protein V5A84_03310 [Planctomycetota bacterium]
MNHVEKTWEQGLGPLVVDLPPFDVVTEELRERLPALLAEEH